MKTTQQKAKEIVDHYKTDFCSLLKNYSMLVGTPLINAIADEILSRYSINNLKKILERLEDIQHVHLYQIIVERGNLKKERKMNTYKQQELLNNNLGNIIRSITTFVDEHTNFGEYLYGTSKIPIAVVPNQEDRLVFICNLYEAVLELIKIRSAEGTILQLEDGSTESEACREIITALEMEVPDLSRDDIVLFSESIIDVLGEYDFLHEDE